MNSDTNSAMFNFHPFSRMLSIFSVDIYNVGSYSLKVTATVPTYTTKCFTINIQVSKLCNDMFITSYAPADQRFELFMDPPRLISYTPWTHDVLGCGSFTYTAKLSNNDDLPLFI